jgi:hypothetical protein
LVPSLLLSLLAGTGGCGPARNPVLQLPVTPTPLLLKGRVLADSGKPIPARLTLLRLAHRHRNDTIPGLEVSLVGAFYACRGFTERGRVVYQGDPLVYYERLLL